MGTDRVILGNGEHCIYSTDPEITGLNNNILVVGSSGCGKTMSISEARLLETRNSSLIMTVTKRRIVKKYRNMMEDRGYEVWDLNFVHPEEGSIGYDPLDYIQTEADITFTARSIVLADGRKIKSNADPYWDEAAISLLSAEIGYVLETEEHPTFGDVLDMHEHLTFEECAGQIRTSYDRQFELLELADPSCFAVRCWKSFQQLPIRTSSCVFGALNTTIDSVFGKEIRTMFCKEKKVNFEHLASGKTLLFVTTSPVNPALNCVINLFYGHAFKELFEFAEDRPDGKLPVPVHLLADDFATGCPVPLFDEYISIFREKQISVTLLIQSESQLQALYGDRAVTIINNCDSYVFMGSMDLQTARNISLRADLPLEEVLYMPVGRQILFRRGQKPVFTERYDILHNELYQSITRRYEEQLAGGTGREPD